MLPPEARRGAWDRPFPSTFTGRVALLTPSAPFGLQDLQETIHFCSSKFVILCYGRARN